MMYTNKPSQQFAYDGDNNVIYYINNQEEKYVAITQNQKELYDFLYHVYAINWSVIKKSIQGYKQVNTIQDIYVN